MTKKQRFLNACRRLPVDMTPVWIMRQAGRFMKSYRKIRSRHSFIEMCKDPRIAAEVTLQPVERLGVDAAIIFADILLPLEGMGVGFGFTAHDGPVIHRPIRTLKQISGLRIIDPHESLDYVLSAIKIVKKELGENTPLIGFSGAPFTLASYLIEGGHSQNYLITKMMMLETPGAWNALMTKLSKVVLLYLGAQIKSGADVVQLFDSWAGCLSPYDYEKSVMPYNRMILDGLKKYRVPVINFATDNGGLLELMSGSGGDVIGVDWRISIDKAWKRIGYKKAIQGNLDPAVLFAPVKEIERHVRAVLGMAAGRNGHIFNLGHGVLPATPESHVKALIELVHGLSGR
ncbi:MAG: uroporphyrinogen decarboxylase [Deltaproteobacteria bacterium]|nr:uroporphyrinogen decarboxylase [Deltaproteobacteria bacterium]MCL5276703.1 uroporphyrinogen decarboxylase [Deltaproteobacteria bacterium]